MKRSITLIFCALLLGALSFGTGIVQASGDDDAAEHANGCEVEHHGDASASRDRDGTRGDDRLDGTRGDDGVNGEDGDDRLNGEAGDDHVCGGRGDDHVNGGSGDDHVEGQTGDDTVNGGAGNDVVEGEAGNDTVIGGSGADVVSGGTGNDRLFTRDGRRDRVHCGPGRDRVRADRHDLVSRDCESVSRS